MLYPRPRTVARACTLALACGLALPGGSALAASSGGTGYAASTPTQSTRTAQASDGAHHYPGDANYLGDRILQPGMSGNDVSLLQADLTSVGDSTPVTGYFGSITRGEVERFQRASHLTANGVVTWSVAHTLVVAVRAATRAASSSAPAGRARLVGGLAVAPSNAPPVIKDVIAAANRIAFKPYVYGGGHASFSSTGYDCSGSVSYALHGGGLLNTPLDSTDLESYGSRGGGRWISIWANAGHTYMYVAGLRFDTAAQSGNGNDRWTTSARSNSGYVEVHPTGY